MLTAVMSRMYARPSSESSKRGLILSWGKDPGGYLHRLGKGEPSRVTSGNLLANTLRELQSKSDGLRL